MKKYTKRPQPISRYGIAVIIGRSPKGVREVIARLGIEPLFESTGGMCFYDPAVADQVKAAMRKPNHSR